MNRRCRTWVFAPLMVGLLGSAWSVCAQDKGQEQQYADIDLSSPLFMNGNNAGTDSGKSVLWSCIITPYSPAILPSFVFTPGIENKRNGRSKGWIANHPLKRMFQVLYGLPMRRQDDFYFSPVPVPNSRTVFKDVDTAGLVFKRNGVIQYQNCYTIQLTSGTSLTEPMIRRKMISDLEQCFGLRTYWERQRKKCIVVSRSDRQMPKYSDGETALAWGDGIIAINNVPMDEWIARMGADRFFIQSGYPIVDETGFEGKLGAISLQAPDGVLSYDYLRKTLPQYGLRLSIAWRNVEVLVITKASTDGG